MKLNREQIIETIKMADREAMDAPHMQISVYIDASSGNAYTFDDVAGGHTIPHDAWMGEDIFVTTFCYQCFGAVEMVEGAAEAVKQIKAMHKNPDFLKELERLESDGAKSYDILEHIKTDYADVYETWEKCVYFCVAYENASCGYYDGILDNLEED